MPTTRNILIGTALLAIGLLLGALLFGGSATLDASSTASNDTDTTSVSTQPETWTCSMHPAVRQDEPGSCPICGMDLIPANQADSGDDPYSMVMTDAAMQRAQVQTTEAVSGTPSSEVTLSGRLAVDERRLTTVTTHVDGRIRELMVDFTGASIREGAPMATIYSPELISAQRELLEALKHADRNPRMVESARRKLELWELSDATIRGIEEAGEVQTEVPIVSPVSGTVMDRRVSREQHVQEGTILYEVADLSTLWVVFEAYEEDLPWLREGQTVTFSMRGNAGRTQEATISYIDPMVDPQTRTARVRAELSNPNGRLKPDMLVRGTVQSPMDNEALLVPDSAVLWTGPRSLVYVQDRASNSPRFEAREVTLGPRVGDRYVIEDGLTEGEHVVTNGAFRVDSAFQLADRRSMMNVEPGSGSTPGHDHGGMGDGAMEDSEMEDGAMDHRGMDHDEADAAAHPTQVPDDGAHDNLATPETTFRDAVPDAFRAQLTRVVDAYLEVRDALIASDEAAARSHLQDMQDRLDAVDMMQLNTEPHDAWMQDLRAMESHLSHIGATDGLQELRAEFNTLSLVLAYSIQRFGADVEVYRQYCPMAFDEEGAYWISDEKEIHNPYLPENMLRCGEVVEPLTE
ncbi:efflux RND transporter periplasmic adaptor subunit [Longimonas halophila]|nr:efflux RND transporter periplasmic adaptor subunit [Longimonas halophila]